MTVKNLIIFGTRPEAIKMAPLIHEFRKHPELFETRVCVTAQHREMLDQVLNFFQILPDYDLDLMQPNQSLFSITAGILTGLKPVLEDFAPDFIYVHGDTTTTMSAAIAGFYSGARVCHVEAGLRTFNKRSPFPEEINRSVTGVLADIHFAPTETSKQNLLREGKSAKDIVITGNTVIDALNYSVARVAEPDYSDEEIESLKNLIRVQKRQILITGHRRENHGGGFQRICQAIRRLAEAFPDDQFIYPVHLNPMVQKPVHALLGDLANVHLIAPLSYPAFVWLMEKSYLILTDSGGVQEEAPSLGKPVLVMRNTTERPEAVCAGTVILVGTEEDRIYSEVFRLLTDEASYREMGRRHNPYGNGRACQQIVEFISNIKLDAKS
ncbi:non-hydrolyzing UDP-N-acetylglucosamine 2-epimerase [Robiginitalea sp. SC105]|uniref:non-hydrolyzing UDP-N-acetylglucosamine 2-epimerase n=1 Tax=Robiginitalea sp. SC105 TaxID=2762332 RepID=UPI00163AD49F|nr:UDP-N-acetylglucosamine 2-epimerase (non-hydrolyzing) [Robiginitalea sp. SC105]MBC2838231.1 UDP-N-acetylglucosamine 2-epimerase (non-hydrolyzing) [Robiginitalea sp. SC105]